MTDEEKKLKSIIAKATAAEKAGECLQRIDAYTRQVYGNTRSTWKKPKNGSRRKLLPSETNRYEKMANHYLRT